MSQFVNPHLPLITNRVEFRFTALLPPPTITLRQDFRRIARRQTHRHNTPYGHAHSCECTPQRLTPLPDFGTTVSDDSDLSELSSMPDNDDNESTSSKVDKIPKPPGEAGRKNSGGFNLEKALGWTPAKYNKLTVNFEVLSRFHITLT
jgi:hypothetical protein